jgi:hypothetical protein
MGLQASSAAADEKGWGNHFTLAVLVVGFCRMNTPPHPSRKNKGAFRMGCLVYFGCGAAGWAGGVC